MSCPACGSAAEPVEGRCPACGPAGLPPVCPKCETRLEPSENFCPRCGQIVHRTAQANRALRKRWGTHQEKDRLRSTVGKGRGWILAVSILTLTWGFVFFAMGRSAVDKQIADTRAQFAEMDPGELDELMMETSGMTWNEAVARDRGAVTLLLVINLALAAIYFGLWIWARRNSLAAAMTALIIFVTVVAVNAMIDPATLLQGILIKIFVIIGLSQAMAAAFRQRRLYGAAP